MTARLARARTSRSLTPAALLPLLLLAACRGGGARHAPDPEARVGEVEPGRFVTPVEQVLTPLGQQVDLPGMRPLALALSPDESRLLVAGKTHELVVLDAADGAVLQHVPLPSEGQVAPSKDAAESLPADEDGQVSYTGLVYSPDGRRVYFSNVDGSIKVFDVAEDGTVTPSYTIPLPPANAPRRAQEIPSGLAVSPDGGTLYVCGNLSNRLLEIDLASGTARRATPVGVAPYDVVLAGGKAWVSNWGGRRPGADDLTGPAGRGTRVRVDPVHRVASEGSVTIVDLAGFEPPREVPTGRHASALAVSPDGRHVVCADAASDDVSVLDVESGHVVESICTKPSPADLLGASPNALAFSADGRTLYVANGTQNAVAVVDFDPADLESRLVGLLPVGWFPGALLVDDARARLVVANVKGLGPGEPREGSGRPEFNSHQYYGSVSLVPIPARADLPALSTLVLDDLRRPAIEEALLPPRPDQPPRPVPERIGEPSTIRHVVYVIKENRTYDQILGDMHRGDGDPELCTFPEEVTPNQHALAREFVLLDNTYCAGILSADGHQWSTSAFATDYMEKLFAGFPRSYPDGMGPDESDALAYSPAGFIWDDAVAHGLTVRNYGEFTGPAVRWRDPARSGTPEFADCWRAWRDKSDAVVFACEPSIESIRPFTPTGYVGWGLEVPDQYRADFVIGELEQLGEGDDFPALTIICLPDDHTSGTQEGSPTPEAQVADNDLAFGRIVEALSHSRYWPSMVVFGIEDDPQAGWDHVSGYRTTAYCASPWAKRGAVVHARYSTISLLRTIEQILGLPPMNQFDAAASPMFECFTDRPDPTPFDARPNRIPLDRMNPPEASLADPRLREDARVSATLDLAQADRAPEDVFNHILWRATRGPDVPYPDWAITRTGADDDGDDPDAR